MVFLSEGVGRAALGLGCLEEPLSSWASLGLAKATHAEKAINHEVNWEASPAKVGQGLEVVSIAVVGGRKRRQRRRGRKVEEGGVI